MFGVAPRFGITNEETLQGFKPPAEIGNYVIPNKGTNCTPVERFNGIVYS
jgi:hypothetical protein